MGELNSKPHFHMAIPDRRIGISVISIQSSDAYDVISNSEIPLWMVQQQATIDVTTDANVLSSKQKG